MTNKFFARASNRDYGFFAALLFFGIMAILFTFPVQEGDFFWHVRTGQWIWDHKSLPSADTFTHTNWFLKPTEHLERTRFFLKQYWLGQLAFFGVWKAGGEAGIVVLRATIYTGILVFIYWWLKRESAGIIPLVTVFAIGNVLVTFSNERPQIFGYLFMVFMLYLLEQLERRADATFKSHAALLLLVMLAWSNCHGSFILGIMVIALYGIGHLLASLRRGDILCRPLLAVLAGSILITLVNPNGFAVFQVILGVNKEIRNSIAEYTSPINLVLNHHVIHYGYWLLLAAALMALILNFRSMALHHSAVIISLAGLSLTAVRYIPFFVLAAPLIAMSLPDWQLRGKYRLVPLLVLLIWLSTIDFQNSLKFRAAKSFPKDAARFLNTVRPSGNIFNYNFWGGYLMCYTDYPVFADGRELSVDISFLHDQVLGGHNWKGPLSYFQINTIFIPALDSPTMQTYPVIQQLQQDNDWALIYQDDEALIFIRNIPENAPILARYAIGKDRITAHILNRLSWLLENRL